MLCAGNVVCINWVRSISKLSGSQLWNFTGVLKKVKRGLICILVSPNVLQNNPIKLLFQAFCSHRHHRFFLKSPLSINFTSRFNVRQDGWRRNTTVHIEPTNPVWLQQRLLQESGLSVPQVLSNIRKPPVWIPNLIKLSIRLKYNFLVQGRNYLRTLIESCPAFIVNPHGRSPPLPLNFPTVIQESTQNKIKDGLHTFYNTLEHAALPTFAIPLHCALAQPRLGRKEQGTQGHYNQRLWIIKDGQINRDIWFMCFS